jgi:predicted NUDIX family NTP pyrophosphohydrolase
MAKTKKTSAGILLFRRAQGRIEFLVVHPGGPYWAGKDQGAWSVAKGELESDENPESCARREFEEELGQAVTGPLIPLGEVVQKSGKRIIAYGAEGDLDPTKMVSNTFEMEWPYRSGQMQTFPEVDRAEWFDAETTKAKLNPAQGPLVDRLLAQLNG